MINFLILGFLCLRINGFLTDGINSILTNPMGTTNPLLHCSLKPADIVFLLDSSGSEGVRHFREQLNFVKNFVNEFDIGPSNVQISVVSFSTRVHENFDLKRYHSKADLLRAIDRIPYMSGSTHTADAITYAIQQSFTPKAGDRVPVTDVIFVVTDGQSISPTATKQAANLVHKAGVKTFAIGVGNSISKQELLNIASDPQYVFHVSTFDALHQLQIELRNKTCKAISYSSLYCSNHITNCESYGHSVCITYAQWGRDKCPLYCGYCQAQGTATSTAAATTTTQGICRDQFSNCHDYGLSVCSTYRQWADTNCPRYCSFCRALATPPPQVTTTVNTPSFITQGICVDQILNCHDYGLSVCSTYRQWADTNCPRYCAFCKAQGTSIPAVPTTTTQGTSTSAVPATTTQGTSTTAIPATTTQGTPTTAVPATATQGSTDGHLPVVTTGLQTCSDSIDDCLGWNTIYGICQAPPDENLLYKMAREECRLTCNLC